MSKQLCIYSVQVIAAEGEQKASRALREAAEVIAESPCAIQLRYLQTLNSIRYGFLNIVFVGTILTEKIRSSRVLY